MDELSHNPRIVQNGQGYRMAVYTNRLLALVTGVLAAIIVVMALALYGLLPLKSTEVFLVRADGRSDVVWTVEPISPRASAFDLAVESALRRYVIARERIDLVTEAERWGSVEYMSSPRVWKDFWSFMVKPPNGDSPYDVMKERGLTRDISVERVDVIERGRRYQVTFSRMDRRLDRLEKSETWVASMTVSFHPQKVTDEHKLTNPFGLFVDVYSLARDERADKEAESER